MITREILFQRSNEVTYLIKWWVSRNDIRYARIREHGSISDFVGDVWLRLLLDFKNDSQVDASLSTVVVQSCIWEAASCQRIGSKKNRQRKSAFRQKELASVKIKPYHKTYCDAYLAVNVDNGIVCSEIQNVLNSLSVREKQIVIMAFGLSGEPAKTLKQIGVVAGISRERVRQILAGAIKRLQHHSMAERLLRVSQIAQNAMKNNQRKQIENMQDSEYGKVLFDELFKEG